jgi:hypothetical protein
VHEAVSRNHECAGLDDLVELAECYLQERQPFRLKLGEVYDQDAFLSWAWGVLHVVPNIARRRCSNGSSRDARASRSVLPPAATRCPW